MRARRMARTTEAADEREEAEAHTQENGGEGSTRVEAGLAESEEREIEERVKGLYEGLVRGLKRVLLEDSRNNRGQPVYDQTKRRKTTHTAGKKKGTAQASQVDNGSGKGRVALEHTIVVGRVYVQRMERMGMDRRDAGRPPREPG